MSQSLQGITPVIQGPFEYETVAVSQTGQVLGVTGGAGDYLESLVLQNITVATASVTLLDGTTSIVLQTGAAALPTGVVTIPLKLRSVNGAWSITTGAGATVIAIGKFT
jgi:hypothetical protein